MADQERHEFNGSVIVHGVIGVDDFPDGSPSNGLDLDGPLFVRSRFFSTLNGGLAVNNIISTNEDHSILLNGTLGVTEKLNVNGNISCLGDVRLMGGDVAEHFEPVDDAEIEAGSVVVATGENTVLLCEGAYDRRVAGVVSGAGGYRPGMVLNDQGSQRRLPVALTGRVWCKVDADQGAVDVGDMLTTSATPGHAMRAADAQRAFGAVIGKALGRLDRGCGMVPVLVALQ